jgi:hypothetical protein
MAEDGWRDVILLTLRETPSKKPDEQGKGYGDWVVARVKPDGKLFAVTFRSGKYYPSKIDGSKTLPKDGIGFYSFMELKKPSKVKTDPVKSCACGATRVPAVWDDVVKLLDPRNPPKLPAADEPAPAAAEPPIEKMPWDN